MLHRLPTLLVLLFVVIAPAFADGLSPGEAVQRMKLPPGFSARCVASEPMIRQPLSISFDEQGRLWVLQYLQYPNPAGLKPVKQDQYLRTQWDKLPEPPPKGPKGADRITILSDPDEHGVFRKYKDFLTGLNLAHGFCLGNGGIYVVQPPYLLYYADKNRDDVPDGDPEVLLTGFGLNDTHSLANSLQWGPDGWIYGAAGSTSTSRINDPSGHAKQPIEFQQGIWRYHPKTKVFELFSEGGGNTYGLDFDKNGQCIAGTNYGGFAMLHQFPGAYYVKGFSKHGPLHNPYTYGYFNHVPYKNFKGGHVTCGGVLYEADAYPKEYRGQYIAGNLLSNAIYTHKMTPKGASFTAEHGTDLLLANDPWFRPVDLLLGPDGCIYVVDWYDQRAAHLDPIDNWDKTNGRIYRIEYNGGPKYPTFDLAKKSSAELVELLSHNNMWWRKEARRILSERHDESLKPVLLKLTQAGNLDALWTLASAGLLHEADLPALLKHQDARVREWAVHLLGNAGKVELSETRTLLEELAGTDNLSVLVALSCAAKRFPFDLSDAICQRLIQNPAITQDAHLPQLVWWALESNIVKSAGSALRRIEPLVGSPISSFLVERMARRSVEPGFPDAAQLRKDVVALLELGRTQKKPRLTQSLLMGLDTIGSGGTLGDTADAVRQELATLLKAGTPDEQLLRVSLKLDVLEARVMVARFVDAKSGQSTNDRARWMALLLRHGGTSYVEQGVELLAKVTSESIRQELLSALNRVEKLDLTPVVLRLYPTAAASAQKTYLSFLLSQPESALQLFQQLDAGKFPKAAISLEQARGVVALGDKALTQLVEKQFGKLSAATPGEKQARIAALNLMMSRSPAGDPQKGKDVFLNLCVDCHQLHGVGGKLGPDLTTADRKNRGYMLANIVDPSAYIRTEYLNHKVNTIDGRTFTGIVRPADGAEIVLVNLIERTEYQTRIPKADIENLEPQSVSLMPEKLLDSISNTDIRNLFAYLASDPPAEVKPRKSSKKIALISGSLEYKSDETLPVLQKHLEGLGYECKRFFRKTDDNIPGLEKLSECDAAIFFTRRLTIKGEQLDAVKAFVASGKPILGIRTASHGFQNWLAMDAEVFGGNYKGHFKDGPKCEVLIPKTPSPHPILNGVTPFVSVGSLYKNQGHAKDITVLMTGQIPGQSEPLTWVRERKLASGKIQRIFYTSLGHPKDFTEESFLKLLGNALNWCLKE